MVLYELKLYGFNLLSFFKKLVNVEIENRSKSLMPSNQPHNHFEKIHCVQLRLHPKMSQKIGISPPHVLDFVRFCKIYRLPSLPLP